MLIKHTSAHYYWSYILGWGSFHCITEQIDRLRKSLRVFERAVLIVEYSYEMLTQRNNFRLTPSMP